MAAVSDGYVSDFEMVMKRIGAFGRPRGEGSVLRVGVHDEPLKWARVHVGARVLRWYGCKPLYIKGNNKQPEATQLCWYWCSLVTSGVFWMWVSRDGAGSSV